MLLGYSAVWQMVTSVEQRIRNFWEIEKATQANSKEHNPY